MNFEQFYPTPEDLAAKLAGLIEHPQPPILEPSAGTGNLIQAVSKGRYGWQDPRFDEKDFHCVEVNPERAALLKEKGYPVVWNDFLTFNPLMAYNTIIMNPPFHDGAKHLLKALNILVDGGEIACILNAATIKNPFSNERLELIRQLEAAEKYTCEFVQSAFDGTDVEVALIYVKKPESAKRCVTFENFRKSVVEEREHSEQQGLTRFGEINQLVDHYRAVVKAALHLYDDILNLNEICPHERYDEIFEIKLKSHGRGRAGIVKAINYNYWCRLLHSHELDRLLTNDAVQKYSSKLREMENYEFNERNILQLKADLTQNLFESIDDAIMKVWHNFTSRFAMTDYSQNIHYYNGWKTNKAFRCNKKVIIPLYALDYWNKVDLTRVQGELSDIEKAMNYLDNGRTDGSDMFKRLMTAKEKGITAKIDTKYFIVTVYKKNTCHLTFKDPELLKKFNLYCGRKLNWLPDDYGFKPYESLDEDERAVADSFEGRDSYQQTFANRQFYLQSNSPLMLTGGNNGKDNS